MSQQVRTTSRRRQRSVRATVAVVLLGLATGAVLLALAAMSVPALATTAVLALVAGWAAARIVYSELVQTWRQHARDRAQQARAFRGLFADTTADHAAFAVAMTERLTARDREVAELEATLRLSERRASDAEDRVRREARSAAEARAALRRLEIALALEPSAPDETDRSDLRDLDTVVDLLAWEDRSSTRDADAGHSSAAGA